MLTVLCWVHFPCGAARIFFFFFLIQSSLPLQTLFRRQYYLWQPMWRCNDIFTMSPHSMKCVCHCTAAYRPGDPHSLHLGSRTLQEEEEEKVPTLLLCPYSLCVQSRELTRSVKLPSIDSRCSDTRKYSIHYVHPRRLDVAGQVAGDGKRSYRPTQFVSRNT